MIATKRAQTKPYRKDIIVRNKCLPGKPKINLSRDATEITRKIYELCKLSGYKLVDIIPVGDEYDQEYRDRMGSKVFVISQ